MKGWIKQPDGSGIRHVQGIRSVSTASGFATANPWCGGLRRWGARIRRGIASTIGSSRYPVPGLVCLAYAFASMGGMGQPALGNGGPFVVKYPGGDAAAKGILARLDPQLKPAHEDRLRVVKEDLAVTFMADREREAKGPTPPLALVSASYVIENPTDQEIEVDFGFPILRGLYLNPLSMARQPDVQVRLNKDQYVEATVISNSAIYGLIRQQAREIIEQVATQDGSLGKLVARVRATGMVRQRARRAIQEAVGADQALTDAVANDALLAKLADAPPEPRETEHEAARAALADYLLHTLKWNQGDTTLMVEFASLDFGRPITVHAGGTIFGWGGPSEILALTAANLGPLAAIGEQKATQFHAKLAACFKPEAAATYESIFTAWGGDVRERSVDLGTGRVRPREITLAPKDSQAQAHPDFAVSQSDPTVYARVDYLDAKANITEAEKASCGAILKNLPVIFTFAPMNLVHYRVKFPAKATQTLSVRYRQYAYKDTREPASYQLAYVIHPASLWKEFGPINLEVAVPPGAHFQASVPCQSHGTEERDPPKDFPGIPRPVAGRRDKEHFALYRSSVDDKTGELFLAIDADAFDKKPSS